MAKNSFPNAILDRFFTFAKNKNSALCNYTSWLLFYFQIRANYFGVKIKRSLLKDFKRMSKTAVKGLSQELADQSNHFVTALRSWV